MTNIALASTITSIDSAGNTVAGADVVITKIQDDSGTKVLKVMLRKAGMDRWSKITTVSMSEEDDKTTFMTVLNSMITLSTEYRVRGFYEVTVSDAEIQDMLASPSHKPKELGANAAKALKAGLVTPSKVTKTFVAPSEIGDYYYTGVMGGFVRMSEEELLDEYTRTKEVKVESEVDLEDPAERIIVLKDGTEFHRYDFWDGLDNVTFLRTAREKNLFVLLRGEPGTGKTRLVHAAFVDEHLEIVGCSEETIRADFVGGYIPAADGSFMWSDGPLLRAMEWEVDGEKRGCPLFIDEVLLADPRQLAAVYSAIDGQRMVVVTENPERGVVTAGPDFYVVFAGNPNVPGAVLSEALASRCALKPEHTTDFDTARRKLGPDYDTIVDVAIAMNEKLRNRHVGWAPQMRDLEAFKKVAETFGLNMAISNLLENPTSERDRDECESLINRMVQVQSIQPFRM